MTRAVLSPAAERGGEPREQVERPLNRCHRLTRRGRGVVVVQSVGDYEAAEEERAFMRAAVAGLADIQAGRDISLVEVKAKFGLD